MQKNVIIGLVVVVLLALGGFVLLSSPTTDTDVTEEETEATDEQTGDVLEVQLSEQNNSGQNGTATLEDLGDGTTRVTINVSGGSLLVGPQPAHIHSGTCENLGGVVYPLENLEDGYSLTVVEASLQSLLEGEFAINLHQSPEEAQIYTACGNIE